MTVAKHLREKTHPSMWVVTIREVGVTVSRFHAALVDPTGSGRSCHFYRGNSAHVELDTSAPPQVIADTTATHHSTLRSDPHRNIICNGADQLEYTDVE